MDSWLGSLPGEEEIGFKEVSSSGHLFTLAPASMWMETAALSATRLPTGPVPPFLSGGWAFRVRAHAAQSLFLPLL